MKRPTSRPPSFLLLLFLLLVGCVGGTALRAASPRPAGERALRTARGPAMSVASQASVAAKGEFAAIAPTDPAVKKALDAKALAQAKKLIGKPSAFRGTVSRVYSPESHSITILDFGPNYREALTAVLHPANYSKFPDLQRLTGKVVLVTGTFSDYQGRPQIELTQPSQVRVIGAQGSR